jgi:segregation and condensation protein B
MSDSTIEPDQDFPSLSDDDPPALESADGMPPMGADAEWTGEDLEAAYLKALSAIDELGPEAAPSETNLRSAATDAFEGPKETVHLDNPEGLPENATAVNEIAKIPTTTDPLPATESVRATPATASSVAAGPRLARGTERLPGAAPVEDYTNVSPVQIIEAAMFVGGAPLTARKIVALLRGSFDAAFVEQTIDDLNAAYITQERPYEIRLGDGGYRLELRAEFDRLRHRVYGTGPREVRLAQDVLEVLALVAYRQPITQKEIESHGKPNSGNLIRQLLRRDLISFERGPGGRNDVQYQTTPRFLSVFGIASLADLPQAEDLAKK